MKYPLASSFELSCKVNVQCDLSVLAEAQRNDSNLFEEWVGKAVDYIKNNKGEFALKVVSFFWDAYQEQERMAVLNRIVGLNEKIYESVTRIENLLSIVIDNQRRDIILRNIAVVTSAYMNDLRDVYEENDTEKKIDLCRDIKRKASASIVEIASHTAEHREYIIAFVQIAVMYHKILKEYYKITQEEPQQLIDQLVADLGTIKTARDLLKQQIKAQFGEPYEDGRRHVIRDWHRPHDEDNIIWSGYIYYYEYNFKEKIQEVERLEIEDSVPFEEERQQRKEALLKAKDAWGAHRNRELGNVLEILDATIITWTIQLAEIKKDEPSFKDNLALEKFSGIPSLTQSNRAQRKVKYGTLDAIVPLQSGGLGHLYSDVEAENTTSWSGVMRFSTGRNFTAASVAFAYALFDNLNVVAVTTEGYLYHYYELAGIWHGDHEIAKGISGSPGFVQSRFGEGNFEVIAPLESGGLGHWWRDNGNSQFNWYFAGIFAGDTNFKSASVIHSDYDNLEVVALSMDNNVYHYYCIDKVWSAGNLIVSDVGGIPGFVQSSNYGGKDRRDFEVVVPGKNGGLLSFYRNNSSGATEGQWLERVKVFRSDVNYEAVSLLAHSQGLKGLVLLARAYDNTLFSYCTEVPGYQWNQLVGGEVGRKNYPRSLTTKEAEGLKKWLTHIPVKIDAILPNLAKQQVYFFSGDQYIRYDLVNGRAHGGYPKSIASGWATIGWETTINAAIELESTNKSYLIKDTLYTRVDNSDYKADPGYPKQLTKLTDNFWNNKVDASLTYNGHVFFLKDSDVIRILPNDDWKMYPTYSKKIASKWQGVWDNNIDAAFSYNGFIYFFKDNEYTRYNPGTGQCDPGYPKPIARNWSMLLFRALPSREQMKAMESLATDSPEFIALLQP